MIDKSYYDLISGIKAMRQLLKNGLPVDYLPFSNNVSWKHIVFGIRSLEKLTVFRATFINKEELIFPLTKNRFSYPDPKRGIKVKRGRANIEGFPVFYGTPDFAGSILEIILTESDSKNLFIPQIVYVSEWELIKPTKLIVHDISTRLSYDPEGDFSHEGIIAFNSYLKHLSMCFRSRNGYGFSSQWSHNFLVGVPDGSGGYRKVLEETFDIVIYPSVVKDGIFKNYAISTNAIDTKFNLNRIFKLELPVNIDKKNIVEQLSMRPIEVGKVDPLSTEAAINWLPLTPDDYSFLRKFIKKY